MRRQNVPHVVTVAALWLAFTFALIIALTAAAASDSFGHGRFYYAPSALSSGRARTSRAPFVATAHAPMVDARYTTADASSVLWTHPVDCTVSPTATATAVQFTCPKEGVHAFTVTPDGDSARTDTFYVSAMRRTACYQWYFIAVPDETLFDIAGTAVSAGVANVVPAHTAGLKARLWVVDPLMPPSADEQNGVATKPSVASAYLTESLHKLGEMPTLYTGTSFRFEVTDLAWDEDGSYWSVEFTSSLASEQDVKISGSGVSVVDCATDTTYYPVAVTDYWAVDNLPFVESSELASNLGLLNMDTSGGDEYLRIVQSACATNEQVVLSHALQYASSAARFLFSINNLRATTKLWKLDGVSFAALATSTNVRSIVLTALGMSIVTDVNVFFWSRLDGLLVATGLPASFIAALTSNSAAETGVTASTIIGHRASAYCDATTLLQSTPDLAPENNRAVILWRRAAGHALYYSSDGGLTFTAIDLAVKLATLIPIMDANSQWVTDAVVVPTQQGISFNLRYKVSTIVKDRLVIVHRVFGEQSGMRFVLGRLASTAPTSLLKVETLPAGSSELFAYGETLSYSPDGGVNFFDITLNSRNPAQPAENLDTGESIVHFTASRGGHFAVLTSENRVFYGMSGISEAIEIVTGLNTDDVATLSFDNSDNLYVHIITTTGVTNAMSSAHASSPAEFIHSRVIAVYNQLISPRAPTTYNPTLACPLLDFSADLPQDIYLDINQNITFSAAITPHTSSSALSTVDNQISVSLSNSTLVNLKLLDVNEYVVPSSSRVKRREKRFSLDTIGMKKSGVTDVRVTAGGLTLACDATKRSMVRAQCPPGRRLGVITPFANFSTDDPTTYSVFIPDHGTHTCATGSESGLFAGAGDSYSIILPAGKYNDEHGTAMTKDGFASYDCAAYGSPIPAYYSTSWRPLLGVFQIGSNGTTMSGLEIDISTASLISTAMTFVSLVDADFVVWEVNNRNTYTYNATQGDAGCRGRAQSWSDFATPSFAGISERWTPASYVHCNATGTAATTTEPYEVLNRNGASGLRWEGSIDGVYMFKLRVIGHHFSFCDLTTQFAVRVYGAPINTETQSLIIISSIMAMLCILGASYFFYRNTRRKDYYPVTFGDVVPTVDPAALGNKLGGDGPLTMDANGKGGGKEETTGYFGAGALNARKITKSAQFDER